jgi:hypothetical protein
VKKLLMPLLAASVLLTACPNQQDLRYEFAEEAITTLLANTEDPSVYLRFVYHGTPPLEGYGVMVLVRYSFDENGQLGYRNFAYFSDTDYHFGGIANDLYGYRTSYTQLSATQLNESFQLTA